ncbi:MAG: knotted carbamoyltransferase YgeW [Ignavibacteria bacterium]|nr:knotted carbamoyltransferase YgeW [Ignavibacteria bacterium]
MKKKQRKKINLYSRDFLYTQDFSKTEIKAIVDLTFLLKKMHLSGKSARFFDSGLAISIFRDFSTRTRFSFASAVSFTGLTLSELNEEQTQISHGETVRETANMISFLTEVIGIRDDLYIGEGHKYMKEIADAVREGYENGVLARKPTIINLQSDIDHPTQTFSDLAHLVNFFGSWKKLRGKRIAMSWAYSPSYGKPLSVPQGIITLFTRFGMNVILAHPEGYGLMPEIIETAKANSKKSGGSFEITNDMDKAFKNADIVYPKSWAPFTIMKKRTELLRAGRRDGLRQLEKKCLDMNSRNKKWECTKEKINLTKGQNALYMHCLPADISGVNCIRGEVSKDVFEKYRIQTYKEAGYKPFVIASVILLTRFKRITSILKKLKI